MLWNKNIMKTKKKLQDGLILIRNLLNNVIWKSHFNLLNLESKSVNVLLKKEWFMLMFRSAFRSF